MKTSILSHENTGSKSWHRSTQCGYNLTQCILGFLLLLNLIYFFVLLDIWLHSRRKWKMIISLETVLTSTKKKVKSFTWTLAKVKILVTNSHPTNKVFLISIFGKWNSINIEIHWIFAVFVEIKTIHIQITFKNLSKIWFRFP